MESANPHLIDNFHTICGAPSDRNSCHQYFYATGWYLFVREFHIALLAWQIKPSIAEGNSGILRNPQILAGLKNTIVLVLSSSLVATIIGIIFGYIISRGRKTVSGRMIEQVSFLPYLIPSIAFGAIYLSLFSVPIPLFHRYMEPWHC